MVWCDGCCNPFYNINYYVRGMVIIQCVDEEISVSKYSGVRSTDQTNDNTKKLAQNVFKTS